MKSIKFTVDLRDTDLVMNKENFMSLYMDIIKSPVLKNNKFENLSLRLAFKDIEKASSFFLY